MKRQITSLLMLLVFVVLCISGIFSYFTEYTRKIATVHTIFGFIFTMTALAHLLNNAKAIFNYSKSWVVFILILLTGLITYLAINESNLMYQFINFGARTKAKIGTTDHSKSHTEINMSLDKEMKLSLEFKRSDHFWHPQIAVWTEDTDGNYLETLYVTKATAKGIFSGGRTKDNFKVMDANIEIKDKNYRRVNALPAWSYKRAVVYEDGLPVPSSDAPLPDAMSGATPLDNFTLNSSVEYTQDFILKLEINVAFDDNEFYSVYDFADDEVFHNGTGQLGQPSLIYSTQLNPRNDKGYQLMKLEGHGHHSGQNGMIYKGLSKLSTALDIVKYIVVGYTK